MKSNFCQVYVNPKKKCCAISAHEFDKLDAMFFARFEVRVNSPLVRDDLRPIKFRRKKGTKDQRREDYAYHSRKSYFFLASPRLRDIKGGREDEKDEGNIRSHFVR